MSTGRLLISSLILFGGMLSFSVSGFADSCPGTRDGGISNGAYVLDLCLGTFMGAGATVVETGPLGTEYFLVRNNLLLWRDFFTLDMNQFGQWALTTGGGTSDPSTLYGAYTGSGIQGPIPLGLVSACAGGQVQPGGLLGNYGSLGFNLPAELGIRGLYTCYPQAMSVSDDGLVTAAFQYYIRTVDQGILSGTVDYSWNFQISEPALTIFWMILLFVPLCLLLRLHHQSRQPKQ